MPAATRTKWKSTSTSPKKTKPKDESDFEGASSGRDMIDSDALDDDTDNDAPKRKKRASPAKRQSRSPWKKRKVAEEEFDPSDGEEVYGEVVKAPTTGIVPPGQVSKNTLDFLMKLKDPKYNDRGWFKLNELVYRHAEKEWKDFVEAFTDKLVEVDNQVPPLPPKDVIHRIYRDVRFSNDKTPYKKGFSASFSRSGRKGIFAGYHVYISPGGASLIAAGSWCPGRNELATIRSNIMNNPRRFRRTISSPEFVKLFGKAEPHPKGQRQNIFGSEDELKVAPKGVEKDHKDIDLLKCRSLSVFKYFTDEEVLDPKFSDELVRIVRVLRPFVHCLNDMMTLRDDNNGGNSSDSDNNDENGADDDN